MTRHRTYDVLGILMKFHAFPDEVQGKYCLVECLVPPGAGAPPNHHAGETEAFHVLEGRIEFTVGERSFEAGKGDHVAIPDGAVHAFRAVGDAPARVLILNAPGLMHDRFFTGIGRELPEDTVDAPPPGPPPTPDQIAGLIAAAEGVGMTILAPEGAAG